jgi:NAD(P)-dependent dehydrogenase (short-subunit alcohol dehydrogenase family)
MHALNCQWKLFDAQYRAGIRVMETALSFPARGAERAPCETAKEARSIEGRGAGRRVAATVARGGREGTVHIEDKVAVVTGAASGIGEAVARELARRGARAVILVDRSDRAPALAQAINAEAGRAAAEAHVGDATDDAFRAGVFDAVGARHGVVHICVPAAGIARDALAVKVDKASGRPVVYPIKTFREVTEVNLVAPVYWALEMVARIAADRRRRGLGRWQPDEGVQGAVVFIGSVSSQGNKGQIAYAASKAGLEGAAATLMKEAIYHGVRCGVLHPGFTDTPMVRALGEEFIATNVLPYTQLRRLIRPEEIADAICFMIANSAVSGELWADAGWHPTA